MPGGDGIQLGVVRGHFPPDQRGTPVVARDALADAEQPGGHERAPFEVRELEMGREKHCLRQIQDIRLPDARRRL